MGYYGGHGRAQGRDRQSVRRAAADQPNCLTDATTGLIDCGNWAVSASWAVPATAVSGIYFAKLVRTDTGGASHIVFIVRDDAGARPTPVPDLRHHLAGVQQLRRQQPVRRARPAGRAYKVSYNRPFTTARHVGRGLGLQRRVPDGALARSQRLRRQLLHRRRHRPARRGAAANHKVFLSVGHDEYWSGAQRANVEAARDAGVHLAFFSGNEVFWKTRWENSIDASGTPYRTLVCYKETHANAKIDPTAGVDRHLARPALQSAGRRRPAGERADRHDLHGQRGRDDAIEVPAADGKLRFWRNTAVASLAPGRPRRLPARHARLRMGRGSRQRLPPGRADPAVATRPSAVSTVPAGLRLDLRRRARQRTP